MQVPRRRAAPRSRRLRRVTTGWRRGAPTTRTWTSRSGSDRATRASRCCTRPPTCGTSCWARAAPRRGARRARLGEPLRAAPQPRSGHGRSPVAVRRDHRPGRGWPVTRTTAPSSGDGRALTLRRTGDESDTAARRGRRARPACAVGTQHAAVAMAHRQRRRRGRAVRRPGQAPVRHRPGRPGPADQLRSGAGPPRRGTRPRRAAVDDPALPGPGELHPPGDRDGRRNRRRRRRRPCRPVPGHPPPPHRPTPLQPSSGSAGPDPGPGRRRGPRRRPARARSACPGAVRGRAGRRGGPATLDARIPGRAADLDPSLRRRPRRDPVVRDRAAPDRPVRAVRPAPLPERRARPAPAASGSRPSRRRGRLPRPRHHRRSSRRTGYGRGKPSAPCCSPPPARASPPPRSARPRKSPPAGICSARRWASRSNPSSCCGSAGPRPTPRSFRTHPGATSPPSWSTDPCPRNRDDHDDLGVPAGRSRARPPRSRGPAGGRARHHRGRRSGHRRAGPHPGAHACARTSPFSTCGCPTATASACAGISARR